MLPIRDHNPSRSTPLVTLALILANLYGFWLELTAPDLEAIIETYALIPASVSLAAPETLTPFATSMFLHAGWLHLLSNLWFLWIFGDNVEDRLGKIRFILLYFVSGIIAGIAQYLVIPESIIPMLGASGAVAGVLGAYLIFFPRHRIDTLVPIFFFLTVIQLPAVVILGYWFLLQLLSGLGSLGLAIAGGGVAFFAHIGGFLAGAFYALLNLRPSVDGNNHFIYRRIT